MTSQQWLIFALVLGALCALVFLLRLSGPRAHAVSEPPRRPASSDGLRTLSTDEVIDGVRCRGGEQIRIERGRLVRATLAEALLRNGVELPAGTRVHLDGEGPLGGEGSARITVAELAQAREIHGTMFPAGTELELDDQGGVTGAVLAEPLAAPGPQGLVWDTGAYVECVDGVWILDGRPTEAKQDA